MSEPPLISRLYAAFADAPRPARDEIAPYESWDQEEIAERLEPFDARAVPDDEMQWLGDCLPVLGPKALRYFLPRFLHFSITHRGSNACDNVLFHLAEENPDTDYWRERYAVFSPRERAAIAEYLAFRGTWPEAPIDAEWITRGLHYWQSGAQPTVPADVLASRGRG